MNMEKVKGALLHDEGERLRLYPDSKGIWTVGVGRNVEAWGLSPDEAVALLKTTPITQEVSVLMLEHDIERVIALLDKYLPWWNKLSENRQDVLVNLAFNLGVGPSKEDPTGKLLTFKNTLAAMQYGRIEDAAQGLEQSAWYRQVGARAQRLVAEWRAG